MLYSGIAGFLFLLRYALGGAVLLRRQVYYLVLGALFVFCAFRYQVGCDWVGYTFQYLGASRVDWETFFQIREPIWWSIMGFIREAQAPYPFINVIAGFIFFIGVHSLARRQPDPLAFLVLLFPILIINMPMSGIRQGAAIGLICIAFSAFIDRRPVRFGFWVIIAAGFHSSAIVFLLMLPVATGSYTRLRLAISAVLAIPGAIVLASGESAEIAADRYIGTDVEAFGAVFRVGILFLTAVYFYLFVRSKWKRLFPNDYALVSIGVIGMLIVFSALPLSTVISDRFGYYLIPIQAMIFSRLTLMQFRSAASVHVAVPYLGFLLVLFTWTQVSRHFEACYLPYNSWLFGFPG